MACGSFWNGVNIIHLAGNAHWITTCDGERKHLVRGPIINNFLNDDLTFMYHNIQADAVGKERACVFVTIIGFHGDGFILLWHIVSQSSQSSTRADHIIMDIA